MGILWWESSNGNVRFRKIRIDAETWCDSIFDPAFTLPQLKDVEKYVKDNRHLEGIPTQKEVMEKGYDMSSFDVSMLGKVEQLYLHVINQDKQIRSQQKQIEELKILVEKLLEPKSDSK